MEEQQPAILVVVPVFAEAAAPPSLHRRLAATRIARAAGKQEHLEPFDPAVGVDGSLTATGAPDEHPGRVFPETRRRPAMLSMRGVAHAD